MEVPVVLVGQGLGSAIVKKVLSYIADHKYQLIPLCPFVAAYLKKHTEAAKGILKQEYSV